MKNILHPTQDPIGGNKLLYFIPDKDVNSVYRVLTNTATIDYVSGKKFYKLECAHASISVQQSGIQTDLGTLYDIKITAVVAGNYYDNDATLQEMLQYRFIVAREDNNCVVGIFGDTEQPLKMEIVNTTQGDAGNRKQTTISFTGNTFNPERILDEAIAVYP